MIKVLILINNLVLISKIEEVGVDIGEPDCKLTEPFVINTDSITNGKTFSPWIFDYTNQNTMMMSSDKILTIVEPNETLLKKYEDLTKK
jgi:hypothetical protein